MSRARVGFAVRYDWPDRTHELVCFRSKRSAAFRALKRCEQYWRRGPLPPTALTLVEISSNDFNLHTGRRECRSPDCPVSRTAAPSGAPGVPA